MINKLSSPENKPYSSGGDAVEQGSSSQKQNFFRRMKENFMGTQFYEKARDIKESFTHDDSPTILLLSRFVAYANLYFSVKAYRKGKQALSQLKSSAEALSVSVSLHYPGDEAAERMGRMDDALLQGRKSVRTIKASVTVAAAQALWVSLDFVDSIIKMPAASGAIEFVQNVLREIGRDFVDPVMLISNSIFVLFIWMTRHYASHQMERARKRELLAQDIHFLTTPELEELNEILARHKKRAEGKKDYDPEKAKGLESKMGEIWSELAKRNGIADFGVTYVALKEAKVARKKGDEKEFIRLLHLALKELMRLGEYARVERIARAAGKFADIQEIAKAAVREYVGNGTRDLAEKINGHYGCFTAEEMASL